MNYGHWSLLLPAIETGVFLWLVSTVNARCYPVMLAYLLVEAAVTSLASLGAGIWLATWAPLQPVRMLLRFLLVCEVFRVGCHGFDRKLTLHLFGWTAATSIVFGGAVVQAADLSPLQSFAVFRQFYSLACASQVALLSLVLWRRPIIENDEHRAYRILMTANLIRVAVGAVFVKGGVGFALFPYSYGVWRAVDLLSWSTAGLIFLMLGYYMSRSYSSRLRHFRVAGSH